MDMGADDSGTPANKAVATYEDEHMPGAVHMDLYREFANTDVGFMFAALTSEEFARKAGELGVSNDSHVVVYDAGDEMWWTRLWWNLRLEGFDRISVLNGGMKAWKGAGFETASGVESNEPATFTAAGRLELLVSVTKDNHQVYYQGLQVKLPSSYGGQEFYQVVTEKEFLLVDPRSGQVTLSFPLPLVALRAQGRFISSYAIRGVYLPDPTPHWRRKYEEHQQEFARRGTDTSGGLPRRRTLARRPTGSCVRSLKTQCL